MSKKFATVRVITYQYVDVVVDENATDSEIRDSAMEEALYEGECYDCEIVGVRKATKQEEADAV